MTTANENMTRAGITEAELDLLLDAAGAQPLQPSDAFLARVLTDALTHQPSPQRAAGQHGAGQGAGFAVAPLRARRSGGWRRLVAALGGAFVLAGVGTAAMAGLVIGYVQPEPMIDLAGAIGLVPGETLDLLPGFDALLIEDLPQ